MNVTGKGGNTLREKLGPKIEEVPKNDWPKEETNFIIGFEFEAVLLPDSSFKVSDKSIGLFCLFIYILGTSISVHSYVSLITNECVNCL